jgi:hypothetical protein
MKKIIASSLLLCSLVSADTVDVKIGWNLIGIPSTQSASILSNHDHIEKASGGGVGNTSSFAYLKSRNFSRGNFVLGQAYWIKATSDTTLTYTKTSTPNKISLKAGWNLIYPFKTIAASDLAEYPEIEKAAGGGVGNTSSFAYLKSRNFARGESLPNQGYWVKSTGDFDLIFQSFDYQAWGTGAESKTTFRLNGIDYTLWGYSTEDYTVDQSAETIDFTLFTGTVLGKTVDDLLIGGLYYDHEIKLKIFGNDTITPIYESDTLIANNDSVAFGNIIFENPNDYSVPQPESLSAELNPPESLTF